MKNKLMKVLCFIGENYIVVSCLIAVLMVFSPILFHNHITIGFVRFEEKALTCKFMTKLMDIHDKDETALGMHGMGLALGDPEKIQEPIHEFRRYMKAKWAKEKYYLNRGNLAYAFIMSKYEDVTEFVKWKRKMAYPDRPYSVPEFFEEKLKFEKCVLLVFVHFKETDQRELFPKT